MVLVPFLIEPFQKYHLKTNICHLSYRWGGIRKMFYSEKPKDLLWSIGSSYWFFNLGVHVGVMEKQIMAKNGHFWPFVTIFGNRRSSALFELNTDWTRLNIVSHLWGLQLDPFGTMENGAWGSRGLQNGHFLPYVEIFGYRRSPLPYLRWTPVERGWTLYLTSGGTSSTPFDPSKMISGVSVSHQIGHFWPYLVIFGHRWS